MRRTMLLFATMALTLLVASGVALAATRTGDNGPNNIVGTNRPDTLLGRGGDDLVNGLGGNDVVSGGAGHDELSGGFGDDIVRGGPKGDSLHSDVLDGHSSGSGHRGNDLLIGGGGNDTFFAAEGHRDTIVCGGGRDWVEADHRDIVAADCERVHIIQP
jgi:Ca2+-binding RTX toxin-like protein